MSDLFLASAPTSGLLGLPFQLVRDERVLRKVTLPDSTTSHCTPKGYRVKASMKRIIRNGSARSSLTRTWSPWDSAALRRCSDCFSPVS